MRTIAFSQINNLSNEFSNPMRASWLMRDYMSKAIKLSRSTMTKNLVLKFRNANIGFKEVRQVAEHIVWQYKSANKSENDVSNIIKDLMKHKMIDAENCIKESREELNQSKKHLDNVVRKGTYVRREYMEIVNRELNLMWKEGKDKQKNKIDWAMKKHKNIEDD
jgi:hypothetical protein